MRPSIVVEATVAPFESDSLLDYERYNRSGSEVLRMQWFSRSAQRDALKTSRTLAIIHLLDFLHQSPVVGRG